LEENQQTTGVFALNYGLISGGLAAAFAYILYLLDLHYQGGILVMLTSILLTLAVIILAMYQFKKANNNFITFSQALKIGVGVALIGGIVGIAFNQLMTAVIDPEMMEKAMTFQKEQLLATTTRTEEDIDAQLEMGKTFSSPSMQILFGLIFSLMLGFVLSIIPALAFKSPEIID